MRPASADQTPHPRQPSLMSSCQGFRRHRSNTHSQMPRTRALREQRILTTVDSKINHTLRTRLPTTRRNSVTVKIFLSDPANPGTNKRSRQANFAGRNERPRFRNDNRQIAVRPKTITQNCQEVQRRTTHNSNKARPDFRERLATQFSQLPTLRSRFFSLSDKVLAYFVRIFAIHSGLNAPVFLRPNVLHDQHIQTTYPSNARKRDLPIPAYLRALGRARQLLLAIAVQCNTMKLVLLNLSP